MTREERHFTLLFRKQRPDRGLLQNFLDAKRHIFFRENLRRTVEEHKRRSRAAKKAWKARKAVRA